jgi:hypothetical protein
LAIGVHLASQVYVEVDEERLTRWSTLDTPAWHSQQHQWTVHGGARMREEARCCLPAAAHRRRRPIEFALMGHRWRQLAAESFRIEQPIFRIMKCGVAALQQSISSTSFSFRIAAINLQRIDFKGQNF